MIDVMTYLTHKDTLRRELEKPVGEQDTALIQAIKSFLNVTPPPRGTTQAEHTHR